MARKRFADAINQQLISEARLAARTRIDLNGFLALRGEARAAQWRSWDQQTKMDLVIQMIARIWIERWGTEDAGAAWSETLVQQWIDRYDKRWGTEPVAEEIAMVDAIEQLAEEANQHQAVTSSLATAAETRQLMRNWSMFKRGLQVRQPEVCLWLVPKPILIMVGEPTVARLGRYWPPTWDRERKQSVQIP